MSLHFRLNNRAEDSGWEYLLHEILPESIHLRQIPHDLELVIDVLERAKPVGLQAIIALGHLSMARNPHSEELECGSEGRICIIAALGRPKGLLLVRNGIHVRHSYAILHDSLDRIHSET